MVALTLAAPLTTIDAIILVALVVLFFVYITTRERGRETPAFRNTEVYEELVEADAGKRRCPPGRWNRSAEVRPQIGVRTVIGGLVFSITGNLGIILLAGGGIVVGPDMIRWHLPVLIVSTVGLLSVWRATEAGTSISD
jgi:Ca2+/Na+ antiporter